VSPWQLRAKVVAERVAWIRRMLAGLRALPMETYAAFEADPRNPAAAESHLRRALEALLDLGRHVLAKGFGQAVIEYKDVAKGLAEVGVLDKDKAMALRALAGYRNRLVHFYHEISNRELYEICTSQLGDIEGVLAAILDWIAAHADKIDHQP
jgi:uncharacterized protein YutE (UPF0331/DUF86 family)